jgi:iron(III) transport system substrate-binding protein
MALEGHTPVSQGRVDAHAAQHGLGGILLMLVTCTLVSGCPRQMGPEVTVYTSLDRPYSEPVLREFEQETGIRVNAVYDIEATKTTGLVNRLVAERAHPQADVFWNSEVARTLMLQDEGILAPYRSPAADTIPSTFKDSGGHWTGFAARARVLVYNTELVPPERVPQSIFELTQPEWRGKVALADPRFGTTGAHAAALFASLGEEKAKEYFRALAANDVKIVDGNASARDQVARGELLVGFTDTDDVYAGIRGGKPIDLVFPDADGIGTLLIPNTVALIVGGPQPEHGRRLVDYLLSTGVEEALARADSHQMPVRGDAAVPEGYTSLAEVKAMDVTFDVIAQSMPESQSFLTELFIR